jgi:hypothetical protein
VSVADVGGGGVVVMVMMMMVMTIMTLLYFSGMGINETRKRDK